MRVRFAGFGGQGIVMAAQLLGHGAVKDDLMAIQSSSYGSAARGGNCAGDVTIETGEIYEILPEEFDAMVVMSQPALAQYLPRLKKGGTLITDAELVKVENGAQYSCFAYPATREAADKFGNKLFANILMLGFTVGVEPMVNPDSLREVIRGAIKKRFVEKNLSAFDKGLNDGRQAAKK